MEINHKPIKVGNLEKENVENSKISIKKHKRKKYTKRDPLYYYYINKINEYKFTCKIKIIHLN